MDVSYDIVNIRVHQRLAPGELNAGKPKQLCLCYDGAKEIKTERGVRRLPRLKFRGNPAMAAGDVAALR